MKACAHAGDTDMVHHPWVASGKACTPRPNNTVDAMYDWRIADVAYILYAFLSRSEPNMTVSALAWSIRQNLCTTYVPVHESLLHTRGGATLS